MRRALAMRADLIINGTRARGLANRLVLRHTDWELVRHSPMPLLLVKSERLQKPRPWSLAAIDPLHANAKPARLDSQILDVAGGMATRSEGNLARRPRLHAAEHRAGRRHRRADGLEYQRSSMPTTPQVSRGFTRELRATKIPPSRRHLRIGAPAHELVACAAQIRATLVVMGAVSRSRLERLFIGSTAEQVLDELACDVLIVRPRTAKRASAARKTR